MSEDTAAVARRRTGALLAAVAVVVLGLVAVVAGLVVAWGHRGDSVAAPAAVGATTAAVPPAGATVAPAPSSVAGSVVPDELSWVTVAGARVPVSGTAGPRDSGGGRARGFAHTPLGAVLAAVHISVRLSPQVGPAVFEPTLREQVVGADAAALGRHLDEDYQAARAQLGLPYGAPAGRLYSTTTGYRVDLPGPDAATVWLLIEGPGHDGGSVLVAVVTQVRWTGTDWALRAPSRGDWSTDAAVVTDPTGYTRFPNRSADGG